MLKHTFPKLAILFKPRTGITVVHTFSTWTKRPVYCCPVPRKTHEVKEQHDVDCYSWCHLCPRHPPTRCSSGATRENNLQYLENTKYVFKTV